MRYLLLLLLLGFGMSAYGQRTLTRLWETDSIADPESVLYTGKLLYASLLDHYPMRQTGKGKIIKIGLNGKIIDPDWIVGLDGPKGMGIRKGKLYVADITCVVVIDVKKGKIDKRIPVLGSVGLNDLAIDSQGIIYISDTDAGNVYRIINGKPEIYLTGHQGVNGIKAIDKELYLVTSDNVLKLDRGRKSISLSKFYQGADGLASLGGGNFLVTVYSGLIYYLDQSGEIQLLHDSQSEKTGSADIEYNADSKILYVPTLYHNSIIAYRLN